MKVGCLYGGIRVVGINGFFIQIGVVYGLYVGVYVLCLCYGINVQKLKIFVFDFKVEYFFYVLYGINDLAVFSFFFDVEQFVSIVL